MTTGHPGEDAGETKQAVAAVPAASAVSMAATINRVAPQPEATEAMKLEANFCAILDDK